MRGEGGLLLLSPERKMAFFCDYDGYQSKRTYDSCWEDDLTNIEESFEQLLANMAE